MWMPPLEPEWAGKVQFYELIFGTWTVYAFLVWMWQSWLKEPLQEWRYAMITFLGAGAFWINHYFLNAPKPAWLILINLYTVFFLWAYWRVAIRTRSKASFGWKLQGFVSAILFTVVFIAFENVARYGVENWNMDEYCWMALSFIGFVWLIRWRGKTRVHPRVAADRDALPKPLWRGAGGNS